MIMSKLTIAEVIEECPDNSDVIKGNLVLVGRQTTYTETNNCPLCSAKLIFIKSADYKWSSIKHCQCCNTLVVINHGDKMGGQMDIVTAYKESI